MFSEPLWDLPCNVFSRFDKIHRLIRDLKGAENHCCKKIFVKVKLWTSYLWSINKRPFGSGAHATQKAQWLGLFEMQCNIRSRVFLKYLPSIARQWGMPFGTDEEKQTIYNHCLQLASFKKHGSHPKLANWFAWNKSAHDQLPEFFAGKMIYESQLMCDNQVDPVARLLWGYLFCVPMCVCLMIGGFL